MPIAALVVLLSAPLLAPGCLPAAAGEGLAQATPKLLVNFDGAKLVEVVRWIAKNTGRNYVVPERLRARTITIVSSTPVTADQAVEMFRAALAANGLAESVLDGAGGKAFTISETAEAAAAATQTASSRSGSSCPPLEGISQVDQTSWIIKRAATESWFANLNCFATQARIVPSFSDGKANGFKLFSIRPESLYAKLGIHNGDVIVSINGAELTSPEKALEIYTRLRNASVIDLQLTRRGQPLKHTYRLE